jgi:hypothetical protein
MGARTLESKGARAWSKKSAPCVSDLAWAYPSASGSHAALTHFQDSPRLVTLSSCDWMKPVSAAGAPIGQPLLVTGC